MAESVSLESLLQEAAELRQHGAVLNLESQDLEVAVAEGLRERQERLRGLQTAGKSPAAQLAVHGLTDSDAVFAAALKRLIDGGAALAQTFSQCQATARRALAGVAAAQREVSQHGTLSPALAEAIEAVVGTAEVTVLLCSYTLGAAGVLNHALLLAAHDGNARYLDRAAWRRSQAFKVGMTLLEAAGEKAAESAVVLGATALGVAAPSALLMAGLLAGGKIVYGLSKQQTEAAVTKLAQAVEEFEKLYALEVLNGGLAGQAEWMADRYAEANASALALSRRLEQAELALSSARFDVDGVLRQAALLQALRKALKK